MKNIQLYGAGGHGFSVIELVRSLQEYSPVIVVDDKPKLKSILGVPVMFSKDLLPDIPMIISIGNNVIRKQISKKNNLSLKKVNGMKFNILDNSWKVSNDTSVNYIIKLKKIN